MALPCASKVSSTLSSSPGRSSVVVGTMPMDTGGSAAASGSLGDRTAVTVGRGARRTGEVGVALSDGPVIGVTRAFGATVGVGVADSLLQAATSRTANRPHPMSSFITTVAYSESARTGAMALAGSLGG